MQNGSCGSKQNSQNIKNKNILALGLQLQMSYKLLDFVHKHLPIFAISEQVLLLLAGCLTGKTPDKILCK